MNIINNFLKKINNPVPAFAQTKLEKENSSEDHSSTKPKTTFRDVAGLDEVKEELFEVVDFMKSPEKYIKMGAKIPKGILFYGPPGTGKTLLASAMAGETESSFFNVTGSEFVEKYVGVGAKRVRTLFEKARKESPSIIFIDEIDAIGARRHSESNNEKDQTLNQLLVEMDGFNKDDNILIVGATNRLDLLDEALLRPGRFDRHIRINSPNYNTRYEILKVHTNNKPLSKEIDLKMLARKTHGFNGAHLANIANEAAIYAVRDNSEEITPYHFDKAIERVIAGIEQKNSVLIEKEKKIVSYHESGHAIVSNIIGICPIQKISIVPRGEALGYVLQLPDEDRYIYTKEELIGKIQVLLAGKAAEDVIFHHSSTGAKDDLKKVTDIADQMVCEYGMSKLGFMTIDGESKTIMSEQIQKETNKIVENCYKQTVDLIKNNINDLNIVANYLYDKETMTLEELQSLIQKEPC
ncbi:MAG: AAA family ATPase [Terrisporobacter sp.]